MHLKARGGSVENINDFLMKRSYPESDLIMMRKLVVAPGYVNKLRLDNVQD